MRVQLPPSAPILFPDSTTPDSCSDRAWKQSHLTRSRHNLAEMGTPMGTPGGRHRGCSLGSLHRTKHSDHASGRARQQGISWIWSGREESRLRFPTYIRDRAGCREAGRGGVWLLRRCAWAIVIRRMSHQFRFRPARVGSSVPPAMPGPPALRGRALHVHHNMARRNLSHIGHVDEPARTQTVHPVHPGRN